MQSQKVSKLGSQTLFGSQSDSPLPKHYTPSIMIFNNENSQFELNSVIIEENSSDSDQNLLNTHQSYTPCFLDYDQKKIVELTPIIDKLNMLDGFEAGINWKDVVKSSARRVRIMENGDEVEDCTWAEMKRKHIEWSEHKKDNFCKSFEKDYGSSIARTGN